MSSIKDRIRAAKRRTATEKVCLRGDLAGEYEQLERDLEALPKSTKLGGDPDRERITADMDRLRAEMEDGTVEFKLEALADKPYQELVEQHPPRREGDDLHPSDARWLFNWATFPQALIRACTVEPTMDAADWDYLFTEALSPGQMADLRTAAISVNGRSVDVPFSPAASNVSPS